MSSSVIPRLRSAAVDFMAHAATFGAVRGSWLFTTSRLGPKTARRRVTVAMPGTGVPLTLRLRTSDALVFWEIFAKHEYGWNFAAKPRVIVDVGGYTGLSAAFFAHQYPEATIIAVEPDAENFELLTRNTASFPNVHAVHAAVWRESGMISLTDPGNGEWGFQVDDQPGTPDGKLVRAVTVEELIKEFNLDRVDLLKVDVEGSEKEIFAAAGSWLPAVDVICIELHDRFKAGCSRSFFTAVGEFPIELRRNEDVLVARADSPLAPVSAW
jgi:FkbM family methyltransferase